jgi:hypothetical protein
VKAGLPIRISLLAGLLMLALPARPAIAQTLYKSTLPNGKVTYGDKPAPGAVKVEAIKPDTSKTGIGPGAPTAKDKARDAATLKEMEKARLEREAADARVRAARNALRDAEAARAAGAEPLEGERTGFIRQPTDASKDKGPVFGTRLTDAYFDRQQKLEQAVEAARRNLEQVLSDKQ